MTHGWDDGKEPWNDRDYFDLSLPSGVRQAKWSTARGEYQTRTRDDSTLNEKLFPDRAAELRGSLPTEVVSMDCFVATSAFEGQAHPAVESLRTYRDQVLSETTSGKVFISAYYNGLGQAGARLLDSVPSLKPLVRGILEVLVDTIVDPVLQARESDDYIGN